MPPNRRRIHIGHVPVDAVTMDQTVDDIEAMITSGEGGSVFTPNVDHVVLADEDEQLRHAYETVSLSIPDGMPILWASRLLGTPLPEKVSGSDLVLPLMARASVRGFRVYLLGGAEGVAEQAAERLHARFPGLTICGMSSPRVAVDDAEPVRAEQVARVKETHPAIVLVAFGAPKQEVWIRDAAPALRPCVLLGIGASLDFIAGVAQRSPAWMSNAGLEWLYRLGKEPRRLWRRYLLRDPKFLAILARTASASRRRRTQER
jgi:N-acetylglucosaminyldiphosphoundecaprenol N-acetyl-beta-D-mannosaminyltransferase